MSIDLKGHQIEGFRDALTSAFPSYGDLSMMVRIELGTKLQDISPPEPMPKVAFALILWAEERDLVERLLVGAMRTMGTNRKLLRFAQEVALSSNSAPAPALESMLIPSAPFENVAKWRAQLALVERCVGRVEIQQGANWIGFGTGFLVGPDLLMTNWHVAEQLQGAQARVQLDFALDAGGEPIAARTCLFAAAQPILTSRTPSWLIASSAIVDLDYALVRLREKVGSDPSPNGTGERGFLRPKPRGLMIGEPLLILQHPNADYLKLGIGSVTANVGTLAAPRLQYSTNTLAGSSGSPCFTLALDLVALHQCEGNAGIPLAAIQTDLVNRWRFTLPASNP
jgi:hypothetical protein